MKNIRVLLPIFVVIIAVIVYSSEEEQMNKPVKTVRNAVGVGQWFPGGESQLSGMVDGFISQAGVTGLTGNVVCAIAPHAGYIYSGKVAGYTYRAISDQVKAGNKPETVVVLGFSHSTSFSGLALMDGDAFVSPIGETVLDNEGMDILVKSTPKIYRDYKLFGREHSAENQIPFIRKAAPNAKLIVGLMGDHDIQTVNAVVSALKELSKKKKIIVIASTDLLHDADYEKVAKTDKTTLDKIASMDAEGLSGSWSYGNQVCCGVMPVLTVMKLAKELGSAKGSILYYRNSGDDFPESRGQWVVGYGSVVFTAPEKK